MEPKKSPARLQAEIEYQGRQQDWEAQLWSDSPDWERLDEIDQELRSLEETLKQFEFDDLLGGG